MELVQVTVDSAFLTRSPRERPFLKNLTNRIGNGKMLRHKNFLF